MNTKTTELKPSLRIAGQGFERNTSGVCDIYLHVGSNSFSCASASPASRRFLGFEHWDFDHALDADTFNNLLDESTLLSTSRQYRKAICSLSGRETMFIPASLFDAASISEQMALGFGSAVLKKQISSEEIPMMQISNSFTYDSEVHAAIAQRLRHVEFHHSAALRLRYLAAIGGPGKDVLVLVDVDGACMHITAVRSSTLMFHNTFEFKTPEELTYYLLLVFEQLKLNPEVADVFFTGTTSKEDPAFAMACRYVSHCRLAGLPTIYTYESEFSFLDSNRFFNLFCGPVCVS
ncbi:MAG: DUF3822 family protein, partial [Bacteroidota bacterium]